MELGCALIVPISVTCPAAPIQRTIMAQSGSERRLYAEVLADATQVSPFLVKYLMGKQKAGGVK